MFVKLYKHENGWSISFIDSHLKDKTIVYELGESDGMEKFKSLMMDLVEIIGPDEKARSYEIIIEGK